MVRPYKFVIRQRWLTGISSLRPTTPMGPCMPVAARPILSLRHWGWEQLIDGSESASRLCCSAAPASVAAPPEVLATLHMPYKLAIVPPSLMKEAWLVADMPKILAGCL